MNFTFDTAADYHRDGLYCARILLTGARVLFVVVIYTFSARIIVDFTRNSRLFVEFLFFSRILDGACFARRTFADLHKIILPSGHRTVRTDPRRILTARKGRPTRNFPFFTIFRRVFSLITYIFGFNDTKMSSDINVQFKTIYVL